MHLLFISSLLPDARSTTGFEIANRAIAEGLEDAGARLTLVGFRRPGAARPERAHVDLGELAIENGAAGRAQKIRWVLDAWRSGLPVGSAKLRGLGEAALRARLTEAGPFDAVVLSSVQMPIAYPFLSTLAPAIFVAHNVEHLSAAENARHARSAVARFLYRREAKLLQGAEARLCREAAVIHSLAAEDARNLGLADDPRSIPLSLTVGHGGPREDDGARAADVVMIGTWSWAPNRAGLDWFVESVAPLLPADVSVAIAGRFDGAPPAAPPQVSFHGRVPDAQAFVRSGRVVALATRGGTGVQLKTIETLEEGMPAVATPAALRGLGAVLPSNLRVASDPGAFAAALADLVRRERAGETLRLDGRAFAQRQADDLRRGLGQGLARLADPADAPVAAPAVSRRMVAR